MGAFAAEARETHGDVERLHVSRATAGRAWYWTSCYRVGDVLVDSGSSQGRAAFLRWLAERPVSVALATHEHEDHVGNHPVLPPNVESYGTPLTVRLLEEGPPPIPLYRWATWGAHGRAPGTKPLPAALEAGKRRFVVVPTPGHSDDHVSFLDEAASAVFTGDAYVGRFRVCRREESLAQELASLRRLADLDVGTMFPAHGDVLARPRAKLLETVAWFEALAAKAKRLREAGRPWREVRREALGKPPTLQWFSLGEFSQDEMLRQLLALP